MNASCYDDDYYVGKKHSTCSLCRVFLKQFLFWGIYIRNFGFTAPVSRNHFFFKCTNLGLKVSRLGRKSVTWELPLLTANPAAQPITLCKTKTKVKGGQVLGVEYGVKSSFWGVSAESSGPSAFSPSTHQAVMPITVG